MKPNSSLIAILTFLATIALYVLGVNPLSAKLSATQTALAEEELMLATIRTEVTMKETYQARIAELEATNRLNHAAWIAPMLNSYAMRGKSFLDAIATESGLTGMEYTEGTFRALPVPNSQLPDRRTARRSVRLKAQADYAATASFLLRAERDLPTVCLQSLSILPVNNAGLSKPDAQEVTMTFEWPCEGEVIK